MEENNKEEGKKPEGKVTESKVLAVRCENTKVEAKEASWKGEGAGAQNKHGGRQWLGSVPLPIDPLLPAAAQD